MSTLSDILAGFRELLMPIVVGIEEWQDLREGPKVLWILLRHANHVESELDCEGSGKPLKD